MKYILTKNDMVLHWRWQHYKLWMTVFRSHSDTLWVVIDMIFYWKNIILSSAWQCLGPVVIQFELWIIKFFIADNITLNSVWHIFMHHSVHEIKVNCTLESFFVRDRPNVLPNISIVKQSKSDVFNISQLLLIPNWFIYNWQSIISFIGARYVFS